MALKMFALFTALSCVSAGYLEADQHFAPLAHYSSAPAVSYSSVTHHASPRLAVAKTYAAYAEPAVQYAAPITKSYAVHQPSVLRTIVAEPAYSYDHAAPLVYSQSLGYPKTLSYAPLAKTIVAQPAYTKVVAVEPTYAKSLISEPVYANSAPILAAKGLSYAAPAPHYAW
ncbi:cuticle protein-like [Toxorhynchites rutilus septentrionalis]|uniref:cuticle protein-like n=1 Tax=Toxorhynchites rutilus septentrionalis TaxID=329112 RepID=UPI0024794320|nr:cuticle protein-like [Toxorhynchites rutilus septentrionalis]